MENLEQEFPVVWMVAGFVALMVFSTALRKVFRKRMLRRDGQLMRDNGRPLSIDERVAGNREWASGEIRCKGRTAVYILWFVSAVWMLTFGAAFMKSFSNGEMPLGGRIVLGIFTLLGVVPIFFAVRFTKRQLKFGDSICRITGKAGVLGRAIQGAVFTTTDIPATGSYEFLLQCLEFYTTGSGKNSKTHSRVLWQGDHKVAHAGKSSRVGIPFSFDLPAGSPETGYQASRGRVSWQLKLEAPAEGIKYSALFVVPVFRVE